MYLTISIFILIISAYLFNKYGASLKLTEFNFCSYIYYYGIIAQSFISSLLVVYKLDNHYMINRVSDNSRIMGWAAIQWSMIGIGLGLMIGRYFTHEKNSNKSFRLYTQKPIIEFDNQYESCIRIILIALSIISLLATMYYCATIGGITLFRLIQDPSLIFSTLRNDIKRNYGGIEYIKNVFSITLSPILAYIWFAMKKRHNTFSNRIWACLMMFNAIIALTNNLEKAPVVWFLLKYLFIYVLIYSKIQKKYLYITGISAISFFIFLYIFILNVPFASLLHFNTGIMGRILLSQSAGTYLSFEYFPSVHEHLGFSSFPTWLTSFLGIGHSERSARICMEIFNPKGVEAGIAGVINSLFIAESWANWGLSGVLIAPIIVGVFIHILFFSLIKLPKHPVSMGFITYFCTMVPITGGINDFIYPISFIIMITILYLCFYMSNLVIRAVKENWNAHNISSTITTR